MYKLTCHNDLQGGTCIAPCECTNMCEGFQCQQHSLKTNASIRIRPDHRLRMAAASNSRNM
jgi:hypothetical protein